MIKTGVKVILGEDELDKYIDAEYKYMSHITKSMFILDGENFKKVSLFSDLKLQTGSCDYWCDNAEWQLGEPMKEFIKLIEAELGTVDYVEEGNFSIMLEFEIENLSKFMYFLGTGNKGQEISMGIYFKDESQLCSEDFKDTIKYLDYIVTRYAQRVKLNKR